MERWALVSGLRRPQFRANRADLKHQRGVANLFVLGDLVGPQHNCNALLERLRQPKAPIWCPNTSIAGGKNSFSESGFAVIDEPMSFGTSRVIRESTD